MIFLVDRTKRKSKPCFPPYFNNFEAYAVHEQHHFTEPLLCQSFHFWAINTEKTPSNTFLLTQNKTPDMIISSQKN